MKTIIDAEPWLTEPALIPIPWREVRLPETLKIGVLWHDNVVKPHPPITRALRLVVDKLKDAGVEIVEFAPYYHDEAWSILSSLYYVDGGEFDSHAIDSSGEPWRPLSKWIMKDNPNVKNLSVGEMTYMLEERESYRKEYAAHWNELGIDALLCPVGPGVAPKHDTSKYWGYTSQWNMLDYPGAVFPVCKVDEAVDLPEHAFKPISAQDKANNKLYDAAEVNGLPICLQLVGRRFDDEKVLEILQHIQDKIGLPLEDFP